MYTLKVGEHYRELTDTFRQRYYKFGFTNSAQAVKHFFHLFQTSVKSRNFLQKIYNLRQIELVNSRYIINIRPSHEKWTIKLNDLHKMWLSQFRIKHPDLNFQSNPEIIKFIIRIYSTYYDFICE